MSDSEFNQAIGFVRARYARLRIEGKCSKPCWDCWARAWGAARRAGLVW